MPNKAKTPGSALQAKIDEFLLSPSAVAKDIKIRSLSNVLSDKSGIDIDLALRLAKYFGNKPEDWIKIQLTYSKKTLAGDLKSIAKAKKPLKAKTPARRGRAAAADKPAPARRGRKPAAEKKPAARRGRKSAADKLSSSSSLNMSESSLD